MSALPPPPDDDMSPGALMGRATSLALGLITLARAALAGFAGRALPRSAARLILRRFVVPAEATVRRAILVVAATLPLPACRPRAGGQAPSRPQLPPGHEGGRRPVFCLTEPSGGPRNPRAPAIVLPRITLLDAAALSLRAPGKDPVAEDQAFALALQRRLLALEEAYIDPVRQARRFLRRFARERAAVAAGAAAPRLPLAVSRIPGNGPAHPAQFRKVLLGLNALAMDTLRPAPDSS